MKEAFGGIFNIIYLVIFLVVTISILGLVVSYTKAFQMKNAIISVIEEYEGSGCYPELSSSSVHDTACRNKIKEKAQDLRYNPVSLDCSSINMTKSNDNFYCYSMTPTKNGSDYVIFRVVTQVNISFPIIDKMMGFRFFQVSGDTREVRLVR